MEKAIIKKLLEAYGLEPDSKTTKAVLNIFHLGFDARWLKAMCIIKEFDVMYLSDKKLGLVYDELAIKYNYSERSVRKIIADRQLYEIN